MCPCYIKFTQTIAPVLLDVAGVGRLHFGALPPARRALEVRLDVFLLYRTHSDLVCLECEVQVGSDCLQQAQIGSDWLTLAPGGPDWLRLAPGGSDWLRVAPGGPDWPQEAQIGSDWPQEAQIGSDWFQEAQIGSDWL